MNDLEKKSLSQPYCLGEEFFQKYQKILLWLLNAPLVKYWFRYVLRIRPCDCPLNTQITEIGPNRFSYGDRLVENNGKLYLYRTTDFRIHPKFSKRLYYTFYPIWYLCHLWDIYIANRWQPAWNLGFDTLTVYPQAGNGGSNTTCDGHVQQYEPNGNSWANLHDASVGYGVYPTYIAVRCQMATYSSSNLWQSIIRGFFTFDTSAIGSGKVVTAATLSLYGHDKYDNLNATPSVHIVASTQSAANDLTVNDYSKVGNTSFGSIAWSSLTTGAYNDFTLNSSGLANVNITGISKFAMRLSHDLNNSAPSWVSNQQTQFEVRSADYADTTYDPKLVVTYITFNSAIPRRRLLYK